VLQALEISVRKQRPHPAGARGISRECPPPGGRHGAGWIVHRPAWPHSRHPVEPGKSAATPTTSTSWSGRPSGWR